MKPTKLQEKVNQIKDRKMKFKIVWGVHPLRVDKRTGATSPIGISSYMQYALDELHRQFHKE